MARAAFVVGMLGVLYFGPLLLFWITTDRPSALGEVGKTTTSYCEIANAKDAATLTGACHLLFEKDADAVEVAIAIPEDQRDKLGRLRIVSVRNDSESKVHTLSGRPPNEVGVWITPGLRSDSISVTLEAAKREGAAVERVNLFVDYHYADRSWWWELKRWLFKRYP
jgi:hypothetical protein